jgi:hypothetical protein
MKLGLPAVAAGQVVSVASATLLAAGAFVLLRRSGVRSLLASAGAVLVLAPYFMQQVIMSIRAEPLAAAGAVWGLAAVIDRLGSQTWRRWLFVSCFAFTLAVAAKPTAAYAVAAGVLALAAAGRWRDAAKLAAGCTAGIALVVLVIWLGSAGRATEASGVLALAGLAQWGAVRLGLAARTVALVLTSRYLTAMLVLTLAALATAPRDLLRPQGLLVVAAGAAAAVVLQTPGTIITNQAVEPYVAAALYLVWVAGTRPALKHAGPFACRAPAGVGRLPRGATACTHAARRRTGCRAGQPGGAGPAWSFDVASPSSPNRRWSRSWRAVVRYCWIRSPSGSPHRCGRRSWTISSPASTLGNSDACSSSMTRRLPQAWAGTATSRWGRPSLTRSCAATSCAKR